MALVLMSSEEGNLADLGFNTKSVKAVATKFLPLCEGISGTNGALNIDPTYQEDEIDIPTDALVLDLARFDEEGGDFGDQS